MLDAFFECRANNGKAAELARPAAFLRLEARLAQREAQRDAGDPTTERAMPRTAELIPIIPGSKRKRPAPPPQLNAREAQIWTEITARLPAEWFTASAPLLKELTRHIRLADDLAEDLARAQTALDELRQMPEPPAKLLREATKDCRALLRMHGFQSQRIGSLSTKLRLTPQARYAPSVAKTAATATSCPEPWNDW
jgi:hypothetical protein